MSRKDGKPYHYKPSTAQRLADLEMTETGRYVLKEYEWTPPGGRYAIPVTVWRIEGESAAGTPYRWIREIQYHVEYRRTLQYALARIPAEAER